MSNSFPKAEYSSKPKLMLSFEIDREQAISGFLRSFSKNKFTPVEFVTAARHGEIEAVYFPVQIFDTQLSTQITAACTKRENNSVSNFTAERTVESKISQILFSANNAVDDPLLRMLEPFDLDKLVPFDKKTAAEAEIQAAESHPDQFVKSVKEIAEAQAMEAVQKSLKGYTDRKITSCKHTYNSASATLALFPMWVLNCEYKEEFYPVFMNGQTGRIVGVPPKSTKKIAAFFAAGAMVGAVLGQIIWTVVSSLW